MMIVAAARSINICPAGLQEGLFHPTTLRISAVLADGSKVCVFMRRPNDIFRMGGSFAPNQQAVYCPDVSGGNGKPNISQFGRVTTPGTPERIPVGRNRQ